MTLEKILRGIAISSVFVLPFVCLFVAETLFFPFITGKNFAFRIITEIGFGAWIALALVSSDYRPKRSWVLGALAIFVMIILIADLQGVYPFKSIWSNYERMDGWVTLLHLLMYVVTASAVMKTEKLWRWLMWTTLGVSVILSFYGLLQIAGITALGQGGTGGLNARIDATFGNPIYFAVYMLFHVFIAGMLWTQTWVERGPGKRMVISIVYGAIILMDTYMLLATATRGTILGLLGGATLATLLILVQANKSKTAWRVAVGGIIAIAITVGIFWLIKDQAWVQRVSFLNRMAGITLTESTVKARFLNWSMAWQGVQERPILGWGQENYAIVFDKYYDPRMHGQEPWFDRVHNIIFDWWVAGGTLGLLAYLSIFAATIWAIWRSGAFTVSERALLTGLLAGYFVHNFFVFDNVTSYILFGTILAFVIYRTSAHGTPILNATYIKRAHLPFVAIGAVLLVWILAWGVNAKALAENRTLLQALATQGNLQQTLDLFKKAIAYNAFGTQEAREQLVQYASQVAQANVPVEIKQQFYDLATREMAKQMTESELDARFPLFLGVLYGAYGDAENARLSLDRAQQLSPTKQSIFFERAQSAELRGDTERALALFKEAHELAPHINEPRILYAGALYRAGRGSEGDAIIEPLIENGQAADSRLLASLMTKKDYQRIIKIWTAFVKKNPEDLQGMYTLAAVYYEAGDKNNAIATLEKAAQEHPEMRQQILELITQVRNGTIQTQ
jgi:O-antigen ligase/tetratricopeptide (TPR) repeat protein